MKILSLFDGMACGALAMERAGIQIDKYIAYEVDKYAIQTATHNFPFIEERGDVFKADFTEYRGFDYLIGGSPCTYWSIAQTKNRETVASGMGWELFSQYVRALHEAQPKYFLYENNKSMSAAIRASITETFGFEPICINSALVSAQNRQRLYWCGIRQDDGSYKKADIEQPADRGILLKDILETGVTWRDKSHVIDATYYKGGTLNGDKLHQNATRLMAAEPINVMKYELQSVENKDVGIVGILDMAGQDQIKRVYGTNGKCATLTTCQGGHREPKVFEKIAEPINAEKNGKARPLTATYFKYAVSDSFKKANPRMGIVEPVCLRYERTDEGKKLRKQYENHEIKHGYHELSELHPRPDGKTNTLSTVQKDNMILEPLNADDIKYCNDKNIAHICRPFGSKAKVITENEKAPTLMAAMGTGGGNGVYYAENMKIREVTKAGYTEIKAGNCVDMAQPNSKTRRGQNMAEKSNCLQTTNEFYQYCGTTNAPIYEVKDGFITVKGKQYPIKLVDGFYIIRKLTVRECMRLQTVKEGYEWPVSKSQAYKMLGNGWTVEVIAHLLRGLK